MHHHVSTGKDLLLSFNSLRTLRQLLLGFRDMFLLFFAVIFNYIANSGTSSSYTNRCTNISSASLFDYLKASVNDFCEVPATYLYRRLHYKFLDVLLSDRILTMRPQSGFEKASPALHYRYSTLFLSNNTPHRQKMNSRQMFSGIIASKTSLLFLLMLRLISAEVLSQVTCPNM